MVSNDTTTWYCPNFLDIATLSSQNPDRVLNLTISSNIWEGKCFAKVNETYFNETEELMTNFTITFSCPNCTQGYQVGLTEYYVNQGGPYSNQFYTQVNSKFKQIYIQLMPIIIKTTENLFDVNSQYSTELYMSQLTNSIMRNDETEPAGV